MRRQPQACLLLTSLLATCWLCGCGASSTPPTSSLTPPDVPAPGLDDVNLTAVGDLLLDRGVADAIAAQGKASILAIVAAQLQAADLTFANLECPLATVGLHDVQNAVFRADPATIEVLLLGGIDIVSLANNHTLNSGPEALVETMDHLEAAGIAYVGAARQPEHGSDPVYLKAQGRRIGFLAYTDLTFPHGSYSKVDESLTQLRSQIAQARLNCDLLVTSYHWGDMDSHEPTDRQVAVAHASIEAGADVVLGHHPHVLQGVEIYQGRLILYSLGNCVFDARSTDQAESGIFQVYCQPDGNLQLWVTPIVIPAARMGPEYAIGASRDAILNRLVRLSWERGTQVQSRQGLIFADCAVSANTLSAPGRPRPSAGLLPLNTAPQSEPQENARRNPKM